MLRGEPVFDGDDQRAESTRGVGAEVLVARVGGADGDEAAAVDEDDDR